MVIDARFAGLHLVVHVVTATNGMHPREAGHTENIGCIYERNEGKGMEVTGAGGGCYHVSHYPCIVHVFRIFFFALSLLDTLLSADV